MGKPAARANIDTGAHSGPIVKGSPDVKIGGMPAARKGDPVTCSLHGDASIVEGSASVFINGQPAARMGDKTCCGTAAKPASYGPTKAEDKIKVHTLAPNVRADGTSKNSPDYIDAKAMYLEYGTKDRTGDGSRDQAVFGTAIVDLKTKGKDKPIFGEGNGGLGGGANISVAKVDAMAGAYGSNGIGGAEVNAKAVGVGGGVEGHVGKEDVAYLKGEAKGDIGYAEAGAKAEGYAGGSENAYGFDLSAVAEAGVARGSIGASGDLFGQKLGGSSKANETSKVNGEWTKKPGGKGGGNYLEGKAGGVGGDIGLGIIADTDDYTLRVKAKLGAELGLGLEIGVDFTLKFWFSDKKPAIVPGQVLIGCANVLIG
ncbi:PAAR domain-containing protein [Pedobacter sp. MR2016-24]|uniref:PAAR domain-containing protein n=1 Tax=Pedobacter sp. MR2016-24 TaxID=2994466 RepID=UPI00224701AE|nr:PAAR domain-containing protein [Pedobacter sp. MR2016-24]MCX2483045.1 PAAR domain-containing protein [Pedobacter sp. MR2016-24]